MSPITVPMMVKQSQPVLAITLLVLVGVAILGVCWLMFHHERHARKRKKQGHSNHTGHHGNH